MEAGNEVSGTRTGGSFLTFPFHGFFPPCLLSLSLSLSSCLTTNVPPYSGLSHYSVVRSYYTIDATAKAGGLKGTHRYLSEMMKGKEEVEDRQRQGL